jgi:methionyl-tRNA formyltransferase
MKVVILGKGLMLANLVLAAKDAGADIVGVFRYEHTCENRFKLFLKDLFNPDPEVTLIKELKLNQIRLKSANSPAFRKLLINQNVDLLLVGTWKERLKKEIYSVPTVGTVNVHPSLLPKYRGPNPYIQTILHGETETGVTLHLVDDGFDTGAILSQEKIQIAETDTSKELREKSVRVARKLVAEFILDLNNKVITPIKQSDKFATYFPNISGEEKMIDFKFQTSEDIIRTVRAIHPFLPSYITCDKNFFVVDPYSMQIVYEDLGSTTPGDVVLKYPERRSLTIVCKDGKAIRFSNLKLYKFPILTSWFIDKYVETIS